MFWLQVTCVVGAIAVLAAAAAGRAAETVPRSDGGILRVDFENFTDGVYAPLNAGVVTIGQQRALVPGGGDGRAEVTRNFGFSGSRCLRLTRTAEAESICIWLQRRWNAPAGSGETVAEFTFRPVVSGAAELDDLLLWRGEERDFGAEVGIELRANGSAETGTYDVELRCGKSEEAHATMKADLAGGRLPSGKFGANAAWWAIVG